MICLITPTGGRPEGMELLEQYITLQNYDEPVRWIVIDDVNPATPLPDICVEVIRPPWRWQRGENTQCRSMALALDQVGDDDIVIICEDDDCYMPNHITDTLRSLETVELTGEKTSHYYNVSTRRWQLIPGKIHASLCSVGVRGGALRLLREICTAGTRTIDIDLWRRFSGPKRMTESANVIGIKGLPGRAGIGIGHRRGFGIPDTSGVLRQWLGDHADYYSQFAA
jgi:hypothetical protein